MAVPLYPPGLLPGAHVPQYRRSHAQFDQWRRLIANGRVHATTGRVVDEAFAEEQPSLIPLPVIAYSAVLSVERRVGHEGMVLLGGNLHSVPDATRKRTVEVQTIPTRRASSKTAF